MVPRQAGREACFLVHYLHACARRQQQRCRPRLQIPSLRFCLDQHRRRRDDRLVVIVVIIMPEEAVGLSQEDENRKYVASVSLYLSGNAIHA